MQLLQNGKQQFIDQNGAPLVGGLVYHYAPGTNNPVFTYKDQAGQAANTNPIQLDSRGQAIIWASGTIRQLVTDAFGVTIWDQVVSVPDVSAAASALQSTLAQPSGSSGIGFLQSGNGAVARTLQEKGRETISILDFITDPAERLAIVAGTSTVDHTTEIQKAIDAAGSQYRLMWFGTVYTKSLSSSASVDWEFAAGAKVKQIPATYTASHVTLTGPRIRLENAEFDGNQDAMIAGQGGGGLWVAGVSPTLIGVRTHDYNGKGYTCISVCTGAPRGLHIGCSFDDNAGLGAETTYAAYVDFLNCTFDRNGYGFQKTRTNYADTSHGFVAFGVAIRLRSHHLTFTNCHARDNGREGFNVNQGSYAIKFAQCIAVGNDDGGFTIASDNTGTNIAGEGEPCFDIEYVGCESYNNYTSGLVGYQSCSNVRVVGGRYYNNHRIAGNQAASSSFYNGIYFAGGSNGIDIDACVYDERQVRSITAVSGGVLTAAGWVPGTMNNYPKVAIYSGADQSFKGYGKITAEAAGSVTITPTANNSVTLSAIAVGDYVSQAIQHNGVFLDNNCQGTAAVAGAGHRVGANGSLTGKNIISGAYASGQNVLLPRERSGTELLLNPTFDTDITNWAFNLTGGGTAQQNTSGILRSAASLRMAGGTAEAVGDAGLSSGALAAVAGSFVEWGGLVYASARGDALLTFFWYLPGVGTPYSTTVTHPGGGWRALKIGTYVPSEATAVTCRVRTAIGKVAYFDSMSFKAIELHADSREYSFPSRSLPY